MQLMIDILAETPDSLRIAGNFLLTHAGLLEKSADVPQGSPSVPVAPQAPSQPVITPPPAMPAILHVADQEASAPDAPDAPELPIVPNAPSTIIGVSVAPTPSYDSAGVPFDARIHQALLNKKADGTWKIKKGIETKSPGLVEQVMKELAPHIRVPGGAQTVLVAPVAPEAPALPATTIDAPDAPPMLDPYRALVRKISEARVANRITAEEINQAVASTGAPSLQLLPKMEHLIPHVEAAIDAILITR